MKELSTTTLEVLDQMVTRLKTDSKNNMKMEIPMSFLIGSLFPDAYDNLKQFMVKEYSEGYKAGYEDGKNEA